MKHLLPAMVLTLTLSACGNAPSTDGAAQAASSAVKDFTAATADCSSAPAGSLCTVDLVEGKTIGACTSNPITQGSTCVIGTSH